MQDGIHPAYQTVRGLKHVEVINEIDEIVK